MNFDRNNVRDAMTQIDIAVRFGFGTDLTAFQRLELESMIRAFANRNDQTENELKGIAA